MTGREHTPPLIERPSAPAPSLAEVLDDVGVQHLVNGLTGFIFAATGPVAIILSACARGGLGQTEIASWIFAAFLVNGLLTLFLSWRWRMPLVHFWTIPGTVLVGEAFAHSSHSDVIGAFLVTGGVLLALGASGWMRRLQAAIPMPIVMGMVAGVFLRFGTDLVKATHQDVAIVAPMLVVFIALSALPRLGRVLPPMIGALAAGAAAIALGSRLELPAQASLAITLPQLYAPTLSVSVLLELVVPLTITVLVVQNGQGYAVLKAAGHEPPVNVVTLACGLASLVCAGFGTVSTCLTGATNAITCSSGERRHHYIGALTVALLSIGFGLAASPFTALLRATPVAFIAALAGLAMLRSLQGAFTQAFSGPHAMGALIAFLVTVADLPLLNIGAPFWGLVAGLLAGPLLDRIPLPPRVGR